MGIKKRVSALLLAVSLSFGICSTDYLEVQALEWVAGTVGIEEALSFLLGVLGIAYVGSKAEDVDWDTIKDNCVDFQIQQGQSSVAVSNWWADVIRGKLDTASDCWQSFKDWASSLTGQGSSSGSGSLGSSFTISECVSYVANVLGYQNCTTSLSGTYYGYYATSLNTDGCFLQLIKSPTYTIMKYSNNRFTFYDTNNKAINYNHDTIIIRPNNNASTFASTNGTGGAVGIGSGSTGFGFVVGADVIDLGSLNTTSKTDFNVLGGGDVLEGDWSKVQDDVSNLEIAPDIATDLPYTGVIDIPWEDIADRVADLVGDNITDLESDFERVWEKLLDRVQTGDMTLNEYSTYVQNISNTFVYEGDTFFPNGNGEGENEESPSDKVQQNVNRSGFMLAGLEKVFPFCIPWDIYAFLTLLVAEPVAPVIEYPIYNPVTDTEEIITIDFSVWEQQVIIMRYIFDFLLIIGLLLLARGLIGAGGSD